MTTGDQTLKDNGAQRLVIDIGSTIVKMAYLDSNGAVLTQDFHARDFERGISTQVHELIASTNVEYDVDDVSMCSSANGGLRVGILCLTKTYSGAVFRNQALLAGTNPIFVDCLADSPGESHHVDVLLIGGGIDCEDQPHLNRYLDAIDADQFHFGTMMYAGTAALATRFKSRYPECIILDNPLAQSLRGTSDSLFQALRRAYLDDLIYKVGVSELRQSLDVTIHPTPEIVSRGFHRAVNQQSSFAVFGSCILFDIGGATTDLHYSVEVVRDDSYEKPPAGATVARYVFTDLGVVASYDSALAQLRSHSRLFEFLRIALPDSDGIQDAYRKIREGDYEPSRTLLGYACVFLALDRFSEGRGPGLPTGNIEKVDNVLLTGGAAQGLEEFHIQTLIRSFFSSDAVHAPEVVIDRDYRIWIDGITWAGIIAEPEPKSDKLP